MTMLKLIYWIMFSYGIWIADLSTVLTNNNDSCVEKTSKVLCSVLKSVKWSEAVMFYDSVEGEQFITDSISMCMGRYNGFLMKRYDLTNTNSSVMAKILKLEYGKSRSGVHVLLVLRNKTTELLTTMNKLQSEIQYNIHFNTNSEWIILSLSDTQTIYPRGLSIRNILEIDCIGTCVHVDVPLHDTTLDLTCMDGIDFHNMSIEDMPTTSCMKSDFFPNVGYKLNGIHLNIGVIESVSFLDIHRDDKNEPSFTGIIPEIVDIISQKLNFTYTFVQPKDGNWGVRVNGKWNGLVKDLLDHKTDMIAADLTVTKDRVEVIDFIFPALMIQDIGIIYRKGIQMEESDWIKVFGPLHAQVYAVTFMCLIVVGVLLLVLDRESNNIATQLRKFLSVRHVSELMLSLVSVITLQGNGLRPRKASSKMLVAAFWMFCIVITGTYIGNLTARLTTTKVTKPFNNLEELVELPGWTWGVGGELNADIIRLHEGSVMKKVWKGLVNLNRTDPGILDNNSTFQFARVLDKSLKYAYIIFDAKYFVNNRMDCAFEMAESVLSGLSIALAVNQGSPLKVKLEGVMWGLFNNGVLEKVYEDHYRDNRPLTCLKPEPRKIVQANDLLGVALVVIFGISLATIVLVLEKFLIWIRK